MQGSSGVFQQQSAFQQGHSRGELLGPQYATSVPSTSSPTITLGDLNLQPHSHSTNTTTTAVSDENPNQQCQARHPCQHISCTKTYSRKGDLTRHITTFHARPSGWHCHIDRCPRGIFGKGFPRKDKLVAHLMSKRHGLSKIEAQYQVALYEV